MNVTIKNLSKSFGRTKALDGVSLAVEPGQVVAILGPNGAGKTTLLRALAAIVAPDSGEIRYDGELLTRDRLDLRRRFFFLPDVPVVFPEMTAIEHIGMAIRLYDADREGIEQRVVELLDEFDVLTLAETRMKRLSRGQLYKAAAVAVLAVDPEVWMFDEPFASGMDPRGLTALRKFAHEAIGRGRTVIYSTQILEVADRFSDRVCILHRGRFHAYDSLAELRRQTGDSALQTIFSELGREGA